jgi:hypothetical protein
MFITELNELYRVLQIIFISFSACDISLLMPDAGGQSSSSTMGKQFVDKMSIVSACLLLSDR